MYPSISNMTVAITLAVTMAGAAAAQAPAPQPDPLVVSMQDGAKHIRAMFTRAADQMSEQDYAFRPTPEVRAFGQLLAHVAESNYTFCAAALGEKSPVANVEKTVTTRAAIQQVLLESFTYCDRAFTAMNDAAAAHRLMNFHGTQRTASTLLNFRNYHSLLHWGNAITYMRLRGRIPPSA